jgi:RNA polymerase sigma factor (sigma-70 family)
MNTTARIQESLDQLNAGNDFARDELLSQSLERLTFLAQRMFRKQSDLRVQAETDDVVSLAMIRLHRAIVDVRPPNVLAFFGLASTHIRWVLSDLAREKAMDSRVKFVAEPIESVSPAEGPTELLDWAEFHEHVASLPEQEREVFDLLFYHGLEQAEAASLLGVPLRTLKRRWQHARLTLNELMQGRMPGEDM